MIAVDTNVLAYRAIPGPKSEAVRALASKNPRWAAPELWRSELRNVLAGYIRREFLSLEDAKTMMDQASAFLQGGTHQVETGLVFDLVFRSRCTSYDCEFVALALMLDVPLVTEDSGLLQAFPTRCLSLAQALAS